MAEWYIDIDKKIKFFLSEMEVSEGQYKYALHGDRFKRCLLPSSVYALKLHYLLGEESDSLVVKRAINNILSYRKKEGIFYDPIIYRYGFFRNFFSSIKHQRLSLESLLNKTYINAETRQCISALNMYDEKVNVNIKLSDLTAFFHGLDWRNPWAGGSHLSHRMFFMNALNIGKGEVDQVYDLLSSIYSEKTGSWHIGDVSSREAINGAMKVLTGMSVFNRFEVREPEKLIDLCLANINNQNACDKFNIAYVLKKLTDYVENSYRFTEIQEFSRNRLNVFEKHFIKSEGAFSFFENRSNEYLYSCKVSSGLKFSDIHGTVMMLWGLSLVFPLLDIDISLNEFTP